jgi:hypothetical protein
VGLVSLQDALARLVIPDIAPLGLLLIVPHGQTVSERQLMLWAQAAHSRPVRRQVALRSTLIQLRRRSIFPPRSTSWRLPSNRLVPRAG